MKKFWIGFLAGIGFSFIVLFVIGYFLGEIMIRENGLVKARLSKLQNREMANFNFTLTDLRTDSVIDKNLFANKVVLLNFWEHWCMPCRLELPSLERLYSSVKDTSIVFAIISTENPDRTKNDISVKKYSLPFFSLDGVVPSVFSGEMVPRTYIINRQGEVVVSEIGAVRWDNESVVLFIDSLKNSIAGIQE
jgi:thiol-disulfide isomerase/thioredoxin